MIVDRDRGYRKMMALLTGMETTTVTVGLRGEVGSDLIKYATANEFGTEKIPERSFLRSTFDNGRFAYIQALRFSVTQVLEGQRSLEQSMGRLGLRVLSDVQTTITELDDPPNAPYTIAKKGADNPLIDTGRMRQSVDFAVEIG